MHAYLIVGNNPESLETEIKKISDTHKLKVIEFPLQKIEQVRNFAELARLSFAQPTLIVTRDVDNATPEALNAFLKNLEEPQKNIFFALTARSLKKVLPTILSRCQIINLPQSLFTADADAEEFLNMDVGQKLGLFDKIKDREKAIAFTENLILLLHNLKKFDNMDILIKTLTGLKANGNVNLQLTNLAVNFN